MQVSEPEAVKLLRGPLSKRATSAEFNEWQAREVVAYIDRLQAAASVPPDNGVAVEVLEWEEVSSRIFDAKGVVGLYRVKRYDDHWSAFLYGTGFNAERETADEAKAAAQDHYERMIRSALEPSLHNPQTSPHTIHGAVTALERVSAALQTIESNKHG